MLANFVFSICMLALKKVTITETFFHRQIANKANMEIYVVDKKKRNVINNSFIPPLNKRKTT